LMSHMYPSDKPRCAQQDYQVILGCITPAHDVQLQIKVLLCLELKLDITRH
jgi:hypothetical protein